MKRIAPGLFLGADRGSGAVQADSGPPVYIWGLRPSGRLSVSSKCSRSGWRAFALFAVEEEPQLDISIVDASINPMSTDGNALLQYTVITINNKILLKYIFL